MAAITVGAEPIGRSSSRTLGTLVVAGGAADGDGTITEAQLYVENDVVNPEVATFIHEGGDVLTTRDNQTVEGTYTAGYHELVVDLDVITGDYIGMSAAQTGGAMEYEWEDGVGVWRKAGDNVPCTSASFSLNGEDSLSLRGIGATANGGETAYDTQVGTKASWSWDKATYDNEEACPVGTKASWTWGIPSAGVSQTKQSGKTSWTWDET